MFQKPLHGPHCHSVTYPTRCTCCGERVFYFSCNHGSKVFFDTLGPKWIKHECDFDSLSKSPEEKFRKQCAYLLHQADVEIISIRNLPRTRYVSIVISDEQRHSAINALRECAIVTKSEINKFNTTRLHVIPKVTAPSKDRQSKPTQSPMPSARPVKRCETVINKALDLQIEIQITLDHRWQITANPQAINRIKELFYRHNVLSKIEERQLSRQSVQIQVSPAQCVYIADVLEEQIASHGRR